MPCAGRQESGDGTVKDDGDKRYTLKLGLETRMFIEDEHTRLRKELLRRTGELVTVTYRETVQTLIAELEHYRRDCSCLEDARPLESLEPEKGD